MRPSWRIRSLVVITLLALLAAPVAAASQRGGQRRGFGPREAGEAGRGGMASSFEASSPAVGEAMPEVVVYRDTGEPISFQQLLGDHYTVVILGCLT